MLFSLHSIVNFLPRQALIPLITVIPTRPRLYLLLPSTPPLVRALLPRPRPRYLCAPNVLHRPRVAACEHLAARRLLLDRIEEHGAHHNPRPPSSHPTRVHCARLSRMGNSQLMREWLIPDL
jgi:hypothetical protein